MFLHCDQSYIIRQNFQSLDWLRKNANSKVISFSIKLICELQAQHMFGSFMNQLETYFDS
jgi:hypothetical protein